MTKIAITINCTKSRCYRCHLQNDNGGPYDSYCSAYQIELEPDEAERYPDGHIDVFFRCQQCLESTIK